MAYLDKVSLLRYVEINDKLKLIDGLETPSFKKGDFIFHEGDVGNEFFIIEQGQCECIKVDPVNSDGYSQVRLLSDGDHFGEIALLKTSPELSACELYRLM